jgi:uncharacterized membrane protein (UPF0127 family)
MLGSHRQPRLVSARTITVAATGAMLATDARVATEPWTRLIGLMGRRRLEAGAALVFTGTRQIHTHFMRVPIDVLFYGADGAVADLVHALRLWRVSPHVGSAAGAIELPAGTLVAAGTEPGTRLRVTTWGGRPFLVCRAVRYQKMTPPTARNADALLAGPGPS